MAYIDQVNTSQDSVFQQRVMMAMLTYAVNVAAEPDTTTNHANRIALSKAVMNNPAGYVNIFALAVCTDANITLESADSAINLDCNYMWNPIAGVGS